MFSFHFVFIKKRPQKYDYGKFEKANFPVYKCHLKTKPRNSNKTSKIYIFLVVESKFHRTIFKLNHATNDNDIRIVYNILKCGKCLTY